MNRMEHYFCSTSLWQRMTQRYLLPWVLADARLGDHVLEIGAGYGAATGQLRKAAPRVTSLEYDARAIGKLKAKHAGDGVTALCGDAAALPFADETFSSAIAILVLHHLKSRELQDRAIAEAHRVLRPGGSFFVFEIEDGWMERIAHYRSTFTPVAAGSAFARLNKAGFAKISVDFRRGGYRFRARKAPAACVDENERALAASATA
jgi:ubiquinone/menaquinone biosynthesis C-methylase UbiE